MISVIIPVYNTNVYLRQCVESVIAQTYKKLEIILVDDGSTDDSGTLCDHLAARDERIKVIHQPNGGAGAARNTGIKAAKGEFVAFVDSDDWIDPEMLEYMREKLRRTGSDIAVCGFRYEYRHRTDVKGPMPAPAVYETQEVMKMLMEQKYIHSLPCNKLFRREMLDGTFFAEDRRHYETGIALLRWFANARQFAVDCVPFYHCRMRRRGRLGSNDPAAYFDKLLSVIDQVNFLEENQPHIYTRYALFGFVIKQAVETATDIVRLCNKNPDVPDYLYKIREVARPYLEEALPELPAGLRRKFLRLCKSVESFRRHALLTTLLRRSLPHYSDYFA